MPKFSVTFTTTEHASWTVDAKDEAEAIEKAAELRDAGNDADDWWADEEAVTSEALKE